MYQEARYRDLMAAVAAELSAAIARAEAAGISRDAIILDPGLGFAKQARHSYQALALLGRLAALGRPLLSGPSRKSFLKAALGDVPPAERDWGTAAAVTASVLAGAHIVRVHAVREMAQVVRVADRAAPPRRPETRRTRCKMTRDERIRPQSALPVWERPAIRRVLRACDAGGRRPARASPRSVSSSPSRSIPPSTATIQSPKSCSGAT